MIVWFPHGVDRQTSDRYVDAWLRCCTKIFCASHKNVSLVFSLADCALKNQFSTQKNWIYNHGQKSWDTFAFLGRFPIHTGPTPPLTPQTMLDACIQNLFRVSTLCRVRGGRTARSFRRGCTVLKGEREMTEKYESLITVLSQGRLSRIVGPFSADFWLWTI